MFDFAYPYLLYLLLLIPAIALLYWWARLARTKKLRRFGKLPIISSLMPASSKYKPGIKIVLELIALAALVIVLARPRYGDKDSQQTTGKGIEIMIAFDVSNSMLASSNDDPNGISRLNRARLLLEKLVDKLENDKVGLIVFAGEAKTQMPLTTDYYSAKMYLNDLSTDMISFQGTSITDAINMASNSFSPDEKVHKAIILITDAENHEGDAIEAAKAAAEKGIQIDVIGVGSAKGVPIPMGGKDKYMRDNDGNIVLTTVDAQAAQAIAKAGDGIYVNGASSSALDDLVKQLDTLQKSEFKRVDYTPAAEQFPTFAWLALIFIIIDIFVLDRKISWLTNVNFFTRDAKKHRNHI